MHALQYIAKSTREIIRFWCCGLSVDQVTDQGDRPSYRREGQRSAMTESEHKGYLNARLSIYLCDICYACANLREFKYWEDGLFCVLICCQLQLNYLIYCHPTAAHQVRWASAHSHLLDLRMELEPANIRATVNPTSRNCSKLTYLVLLFPIDFICSLFSHHVFFFTSIDHVGLMRLCSSSNECTRNMLNL